MSEKFIAGPKLKEPIPDCSVAEFLIPIIRKHPPDNVIQVDAVTGHAETSREFLTRSLKACLGYRKLGLGQNDVFCVLCRNSSDAFAAVLGVFWLGGVVAPLDIDLKAFELKHMFEKVIQPTVIICEEKVLEKGLGILAETGRTCKVIVLSDKNHESCLRFDDLLTEEVDVDKYVPEPVRNPAEKTILISPTSGSTGTPKGVEVTHRQIIFQALSLRQDPENDFRSALQTSHFYWVTCFIFILISFTNRTKRIYMSEVSYPTILKAIDKYKPEWFLISAPFLTAILKQPDLHKYDLSGIKQISLGGSPVTQGVIDLVKKVRGNADILRNCYGTSETTGMISRTEKGGNLFSVGKLSAELKAKIVDPETGKVLGANEKGEIYVYSPALMKGYVRMENETKNVIVDGWLRTGDLGYYDENEILYVVDRLKELVKTLHGPISPVEIEGAIATLPGVKDAGVVGMLDNTVDCYLVGLVVKKPNSDLTEEMIRKFLKENLAEYKQLKKVKFVEELPRSPVGKMKRKLLKEMAISLNL